MADKIIKVGFCVAYDWHLLRNSLPLIYPHADMICLSLDKNSRAWGGGNIHLMQNPFANLFPISIIKIRLISMRMIFHFRTFGHGE